MQWKEQRYIEDALFSTEDKIGHFCLWEWGREIELTNNK